MSTLTPEQREAKRALSRKLMGKLKHHVFVCNGHCCGNRTNPTEVVEGFKAALKEVGMDEEVRITTTSCLHRCGDACTVVVYPDGIWYQHVTAEKASKIVEEHFKMGQPVNDYIVYEYMNGKFLEKCPAESCDC